MPTVAFSSAYTFTTFFVSVNPQCEQGLAVWINLVTESERWAPGMWCSVWTGPCCVNQSGYRVWGRSTKDVMYSVNRVLLCESIWLWSLRDEHQGYDVQCEQGLAVWINLVVKSKGWAPGMWCSVWTEPCCVNQSGYRVWGMSTRDVMFSVNRALLCESIWLQSLRDEDQGCEVQCEQILAVWINMVTETEGWAPGMWCSVWTGPCSMNQSGYRDWGMSTRDVMCSVNRVLLCESIWLQSLRDEDQGCDVQCEQGLAVWINLVTESERWAPGMWCTVWTGSCCVNQSGYRV